MSYIKDFLVKTLQGALNAIGGKQKLSPEIIEQEAPKLYEVDPKELNFRELGILQASLFAKLKQTNLEMIKHYQQTIDHDGADQKLDIEDLKLTIDRLEKITRIADHELGELINKGVYNFSNISNNS